MRTEVGGRDGLDSGPRCEEGSDAERRWDDEGVPADPRWEEGTAAPTAEEGTEAPMLEEGTATPTAEGTGVPAGAEEALTAEAGTILLTEGGEREPGAGVPRVIAETEETPDMDAREAMVLSSVRRGTPRGHWDGPRSRWRAMARV
jgi:hypothetical protein